MKNISRIIIGACLLTISVISIYFTGISSLLMSLAYAASMFVGIHFLKKISEFTISLCVKEAISIKRLGGRILFVSDKYKGKFTSIDGTLDFFTKLFLMHFLLFLFLFKVAGTFEMSFKFVVALIGSIILSLIVSPISIVYWIIYNTKIRILDVRSALIDRPGKLLRIFYRVVFGFGNLIAILYIIMDAIRYTNDIVAGTALAAILIAFVFGSVGLGGFIASILIFFLERNKIDKALEDFEKTMSEYSTKPEEAIQILKEIIGIQEAISETEGNQESASQSQTEN